MRTLFDRGTQPFHILNPSNHAHPLVISIPHSGTMITREMQAQMIEGVIMPNTDWYLANLYSFLAEMGFTIILNLVSRYVIDPNRDPSTNQDGSYQSSLVYEKTTMGHEMYAERPGTEEIRYRYKTFFLPYHRAVREAITAKRKHFKKVYLLDLHSFGIEVEPDVVLGNKFGKTASAQFLDAVRLIFEKEGFSTQENHPFSGGHIVERYGKKDGMCEALQIELSYRAYINHVDFGNVEFPLVNASIFLYAQERMKRVFEEIKALIKVSDLETDCRA